MTSDQITFLLQVADGNFPNGAFSHSFGLETLIETGVVRDAQTFELSLRQYFALQLVPFEGLAATLAWRFAKSGELEPLIWLNDVVAASMLAEQSKRGALQIGRRTLQVLQDMVPLAFTRRYGSLVLAHTAHATYATAVAIAAAELGIEEDVSVSTVLFTELSTIITAGVRAIPIGQTAGQRLMGICRSWIAEMPSYGDVVIDDLGSAAVEWEIAQMNHAYLDGRLFMS